MKLGTCGVQTRLLLSPHLALTPNADAQLLVTCFTSFRVDGAVAPLAPCWPSLSLQIRPAAGLQIQLTDPRSQSTRLRGDTVDLAPASFSAGAVVTSAPME